MKIPIAVSIIILAIGAALCWHDHHQLSLVRHTHEQLVADAAQLGIPPDPAASGDSVRITKRERNKEAKKATDEFIAFAQEIEALDEKGEGRDAAMNARIMDFMDQMMSLNFSQFKILINEMHSAKGLKDETRQEFIDLSIMSLANEHPQDALAFFSESSDLFKNGGISKDIISTSLFCLAKDDPAAALEWVRNNEKKFPGLVTDEIKYGLVASAAIADPKLAFKLNSELALGPRAISGIMEAATTPDERTASLAALRDYLTTLPDQAAREIASTWGASSLASGVAAEGFGPATKWLETAQLSPTELADFASGLENSYSFKPADTGPWIEWLGEKLPADKATGQVSRMVASWTHCDFQAANAWLLSTPAGPVKNAAIRSFAEVVVRYEPESAVQWAVSLPPGKDRDQTLSSIHFRWPQNDEASEDPARKAFRAKYLRK